MQCLIKICMIFSCPWSDFPSHLGKKSVNCYLMQLNMGNFLALLAKFTIPLRNPLVVIKVQYNPSAGFWTKSSRLLRLSLDRHSVTQDRNIVCYSLVSSFNLPTTLRSNRNVTEMGVGGGGLEWLVINSLVYQCQAVLEWPVFGSSLSVPVYLLIYVFSHWFKFIHVILLNSIQYNLKYSI